MDDSEKADEAKAAAEARASKPPIPPWGETMADEIREELRRRLTNLGVGRAQGVRAQRQRVRRRENAAATSNGPDVEHQTMREVQPHAAEPRRIERDP